MSTNVSIGHEFSDDEIVEILEQGRYGMSVEHILLVIPSLRTANKRDIAVIERILEYGLADGARAIRRSMYEMARAGSNPHLDSLVDAIFHSGFGSREDIRRSLEESMQVSRHPSGYEAMAPELAAFFIA